MIPHCSMTQVGITEKFLPKHDAVPAPVKAGGGDISSANSACKFAEFVGRISLVL